MERKKVAKRRLKKQKFVLEKNAVGRIKIKEKTKKEKRWYCFWKRVFDIVFSVFAIALLSPIVGLCLLIKFFEDFHSPIYRSKRIGKDGKAFTFYKIRTMKVNADREKQALIDAGLNEADGPVFKMKNDPRITKFGRFLRKFSLDETLQLFNVLNGSMSVIGPRPPLPEEVEKYSSLAWRRLRVKGGLLCFWQIQKNRHQINFEKWLALDLKYIRERCFSLDMKILLKGAYMVIFDRSGE